MKPKRTLALAVTVLMLSTAFTTAADAQRRDRQQRYDRENVEATVNRMDRQLDLTDEQKERLSALLQSRRDAAEAAQTEFDAALNEILTEEQNAKLADWGPRFDRRRQGAARMHARSARMHARAARRASRSYARAPRGRAAYGGSYPGRVQRRSGPPSADALDRALDLTDEQEERIEAILKNHREEMEAFQDAGEAAAEERRTAADERREAVHEAINEILTDEQKEKFEEMQRSRPMRRGPMRGRRM